MDKEEESAYNDDLALKAEEVLQMVGFGNWNRHDGRFDCKTEG
jgi:hypothetical protein